MELLQSPNSPYVRAVLLALHETGLIDQVTLTPVATTAFESDPRLAAANPAAKIPTLLRDDGPALYDSRVILRYLDSLSAMDLYPESRLWDVLTLEATAQGINDSMVAISYETRLRPENEQSPGWVEAQWAKAARSLDVIEARWMSHLNGPMDASHLTLAAALGYIDFRHGARNWRDGRSNLATWHTTFTERPSYPATQPT